MKRQPAGKFQQWGAALAFSTAVLMGGMAAVPSTAYAAGGLASNRPAVVQNTGGGTVRYREGAGTGYNVKGSVGEGTRVTVLEGPAKDAAGHGWYRVSVDGRIGWIDSRYLASSGAAVAPAAKVAPKVVAPAALKGYAKVTNTNGDAIRLRSAPGGKVVATAGSGTLLSVLKGPVTDSSGAQWYQVTGANISGWMQAPYLASAPAPARVAATTAPAKATTAAAKPAPAPAATPAPQARTGVARGATASVSRAVSAGVVGIAMNYVGSRYVFGGTTPAGFDCSGFVYYVLNKAGIPTGRSIDAEISVGTHISSSQLQAGDLVYFANTYRGGISHIGIYIGNGKIVHAADYDTGVEISDLWSAYWAAHYAGAVHISR